MYLDYEKWADQGVYVIDIETDSLKATRIWVMCWKNVLTGETGECRSIDSVKQFFAKTKGGIFIGHNILKFDAPVLIRLAGVSISPSRCIDTLVLSTLYNPSLLGGHSLEAWGERLGNEKIPFNEFSRFSEEMVTYCHQDVALTCELFIKLIRVLKKIGFSEKSIYIQHMFMVLLNKQHNNGFYFNGPKAINLYTKLRELENGLGEQIRLVFPPKKVLVANRTSFKKDGSFTSMYEKDIQRFEVDQLEDGTYNAYEYLPFSIGSPAQRVEKLMDLGWVPEEFTPKTRKGGGGNPKPFEHGKMSPSLEKFLETTEVPEVELIAKWMAYNGRANMINTWLNEWNEDDWCIHGKLLVADTLRLRHQSPNTANIPAVRTRKIVGDDGVEREVVLFGQDGYYTYEARDCWTARPGRVLVGTDADGLELRMLAHSLNRPAFTKQVVEGDPHQYNADTVGIPRPLAKTLLYAIQYGAQPPKVASIIKSSVKEGAKIRSQFLERLGLKGVMDDAISEQEHGRIELVDGSKVVCPSPHAALNYKLQGGGARVMALGAIFLEQHIRRSGLDSLKVGDIHDEWQYDVDPKDAREHARLSVQSIREAGEELNLNVPLDGTAKEGLTWAETH